LQNIEDEVAMPEGTIKKLMDKGFGFISTGEPKDLFFHSKNLEGVTFEELREGQKVSFTKGQGPKGPQAEHVKLV
jgi:CspA family cold shock protein